MESNEIHMEQTGIDQLIQNFNDFDTSRLSNYFNQLSTKDDQFGIYPPYVPHIGKNYHDFKIIMYGMAQNISEPWDSLKKKDRIEKVRQMFDAHIYHDIEIAPYKVMLAIAGLFIYANFNVTLLNFQEIHDSIAVSNYYKFSLNNGSDINPNDGLKNPEEYWRINDELADDELNTLKPNHIITFKGRHLKRNSTIRMNDPSWILQGGGGCLKESGSWYRTYPNEQVKEIIKSYIKQIDGKYESKRSALEIYLLKYYTDFQE